VTGSGIYGSTVVERYPSFEGANIVTGIGFKHVIYLLEEAVVQHFRERGLGPQLLYERHGLCLEIVDSDARLLTGTYLDDQVRVEVRTELEPPLSELPFFAQMHVRRGGKEVKSLSGRVRVLLRRDEGVQAEAPPPDELAMYVSAEINRQPSGSASGEGAAFVGGVADEEQLRRHLAPAGANAFVWKRRVPYFYCHYGARLQHSGYLRLLEEVVDRFLADHGISIRTMLEGRRWIPIVTNARVEMLREALMEEDIYTVFTVEKVFKRFTYTGRMDCYVVRGGQPLRTATSRITHGYLELRSRQDWSLVSFDDVTLSALGGGGDAP
jgi:acyl-CoA thioesterase FadM